jgi:hypothetical protein
MTNPNSRTTRLRFWLSDILKVYPPPGEAWCVDCSMHDGKTMVVAVNGLNNHLRTHQLNDHVQIITQEGRREKWSS